MTSKTEAQDPEQPADVGTPSLAPTELLDSHPRLGRAQFIAWWESDLTGDYPGEQFCEVLSYRYERGACRLCGALERRHIITDRLLVGCNPGHVRTIWRYDRPRCRHGAGLSNYRNPWAA
jgi:hypothetical protein